ncbi:MAG TPA: DUF4350 domain-containing protein [Vicinamibacterales bacterium]
MKRAGIWIAVGVPVALLVGWIASHTAWVDVKVPVPLRGDALRNPFYAAQRFVEALGARSTHDRMFIPPPPNAIIVISDWHWSLSPNRQHAMERWVEGGGRLVVTDTVFGDPELQRWSGISMRVKARDEQKNDTMEQNVCRSLVEERDGSPLKTPDATSRRMCYALSFEEWKSFTTEKPVAWALRGPSGAQAMRVSVGRGSVTRINARPFQFRALLDGDHGWLLATAAQIRRGDEVHFLSEEDHPSLLALVWSYGAPAVVPALALLALALWRHGVRLGPLVAPLQTARRSLAEQIRGTGQFAWRHGGGDSLHAASVRALDEAAARRISGYSRLPAAERAAALARLTGFDQHALAAAIHHLGARRAHEIRDTIALVEAARRQIVMTAGTVAPR